MEEETSRQIEELLAEDRSENLAISHNAFFLELFPLTLLHSEEPKLYRVLAFLSAMGLRVIPSGQMIL